MKILVCTDGSASGQKALEETAMIAQGCNVGEVAIIHVHNPAVEFYSFYRFLFRGRNTSIVVPFPFSDSTSISPRCISKI